MTQYKKHIFRRQIFISYKNVKIYEIKKNYSRNSGLVRNMRKCRIEKELENKFKSYVHISQRKILQFSFCGHISDILNVFINYKQAPTNKCEL